MLPWTENFKSDAEAFDQQVQEAITGGYKNIYLMGTAGEGYALTDTQFKEVVSRFARLTVKPGLDPQIGIISLSMAQIIERISWSRDQGIKMFQISLPSWGALDAQEVLLFLRRFAARSLIAVFSTTTCRGPSISSRGRSIAGS